MGESTNKHTYTCTTVFTENLHIKSAALERAERVNCDDRILEKISIAIKLFV